MNQRFNVGDKVIALISSSDDRQQQRTKGKVYTVNSIMYCVLKGAQLINIDSNQKTSVVNCHYCGKRHSSKDDLIYSGSEFFCSVEEADEALAYFEKHEDYESASEVYVVQQMNELERK